MELVKEWWSVVAFIIGAITLVRSFNKTMKEMKDELLEPTVKQLNDIKYIISNKEQEDKKILNALQSMQRASLYDSFKKAINRGYVTVEEKETMCRQYESYVELGGNSFIKEMYRDVMELEVK